MKDQSREYSAPNGRLKLRPEKSTLHCSPAAAASPATAFTGNRSSVHLPSLDRAQIAPARFALRALPSRMEVAQYITVAATPLHNLLSFRVNTTMALRRSEDARVALPPESLPFENPRQGTLKQPRSLPDQGQPAETSRLQPGHCECGSMTRPLFRRLHELGCHPKRRTSLDYLAEDIAEPGRW